MKWLWTNTTQVGFGENVVKEHLKKFIKPHSKVLCTFGGGSIDQNGARSDVTTTLETLECEVKWEGGILANPEFERLMEIVKVVKEFKPDILLSVGGGSCLDGTKFIALASKQEESKDSWGILSYGDYPKEAYPIGSIMTLPATGSEWNSNFVISRRLTKEKLAGSCQLTFPIFSLLDPKYTMTLPLRQLRNGLYDAMCHCIDQFLTSEVVPMMDNFWMSIMKELVDISEELLKPNSSLEIHGRLIVACSFALNLIFTLGKSGCWGIHMIGHQLTAQYDIDHAATLAMVTPYFLEELFNERKYLMAKCGEFIFNIKEDNEEEKAKLFIKELRNWIIKIGQPTKVSDWENIQIKENDVENVTQMVLNTVGGFSFGFKDQVTPEIVKNILLKVIQ